MDETVAAQTLLYSNIQRSTYYHAKSGVGMATSGFKAIPFSNLIALNDEDLLSERIALPTDFLEYSDV